MIKKIRIPAPSINNWIKRKQHREDTINRFKEYRARRARHFRIADRIRFFHRYCKSYCEQGNYPLKIITAYPEYNIKWYLMNSNKIVESFYDDPDIVITAVRFLNIHNGFKIIDKLVLVKDDYIIDF